MDVESAICGNCMNAMSIHQIIVVSSLDKSGAMLTHYRTGGCGWSECISVRDIIKTMAEKALDSDEEWTGVIGGPQFVEICRWLLVQMETIEILRGDNISSEIKEKELEDYPPAVQLMEKFRRFLARAKADDEDVLGAVGEDGELVAEVAVQMRLPIRVVVPDGVVDPKWQEGLEK